MPAYLIAEHVVTDATKFEEYWTKVGPMIAKYGGRYLTKGGSHKFPEGGHWKPERVVIIEFPDMDSLNRWYVDYSRRCLGIRRSRSSQREADPVQVPRIRAQSLDNSLADKVPGGRPPTSTSGTTTRSSTT